MFGPARLVVSAFAALFAFGVAAQAQDAAALQQYFNGKQVLVKIDMPGSQKGIDLRFNKPTPMDWKEYSGRLKQFGVAIRGGDVSRVTSVNVKKDMIEFQLDGGGFGTFGDDTKTTVDAKQVDKSDYEKQLEQDIANTDDPDRKAQLQRDLDRERARRSREQQANDRDAQYASQMKAQQVASSRMQGGSRFNLRWNGSIPAQDLNPQAIEQLLAEYIDFNPNDIANAPQPGYGPPNGGGYNGNGNGGPPAGDATAQLHNGMSMNDVAALFGQGRTVSDSTQNGMRTEVLEYVSGDRRVQVTYVNNVVVQFNISSK